MAARRKSKSNTKFLIILSAALLAVAAGAGVLGIWVIQGRAERFVSKGDAFMAAGDFHNAAKSYERAVGKDRTRIEWLEKWRDALVKTTPGTRSEYEDQYNFYRGILRQIAVLKKNDPQAQLDYLRELDRAVRAGGFTRSGLESLINEVNDRMRDADPDDKGFAVLRRFRGTATVDLMGLIKIEEEQREQARQDLEAAIAADPNDAIANIDLARWHFTEAERHRTERRIEAVAEPTAKGNAIIDELEKTRSDDPQVALAAFAARQSDRMRSAVSPEERLKLVEAMRDDVDKIIEAALALPPESLEIDTVDRVVATGLRIIGREAIPQLNALVDRAVQTHPADARLLLARGVLLMENERRDEAVTQFQKVIDLPDIPISLEGLMLPNHRMSGMAFQIDCAMYEWSKAPDETGRAPALARAKQYRDQLQKLGGIRAKEVLLVRDAKIAFAERRYDETVAKVAELRSLGSGAARQLETLQILAQALQSQQNYGEARKVLEEMLEIAPSVAWTHATLGEVNIRLGRMEEARGNYETASRINPNEPLYLERWKTLSTALGVAGDDRVDPIIKGILDARKMRDEQGDLVRAREMYMRLDALYPEDRRIFTDLVSLDLREGQKATAIARVEAALAKYPNDDDLRRMLAGLKIEDPVEATLAFIDQSTTLTPTLKAIERYKVFTQVKRYDDAKTALAEAEKLSPEDPAVLDIAFVVALAEKDFVKANQIAQTAARLDVDQLGGLLYQGRLQLIEGESNPEKLRAAVQSFEQAVKRVPLNPTIRKLLATAYMRSGRMVEAVAEFERALEGKPDDLIVARDYIRLLLSLNKGPEALAAIRPETGILRFFPANQEMLAIWLELEALHGSRAKALTTREEMWKRIPSDSVNAFALADLYIKENRFEDAEKIIAELATRSDVNPLGLANLRATIFATKGDVAAGVQAFKDAIAEDMPDRQKTAAYLAMGNFFRQHNLLDEATAAYRQARSTQDPGLMEADRALGDMNFDRATAESVEAAKAQDAGNPDIADRRRKNSVAMLNDAVASYETVLAAVKDNPRDYITLAKRLAETHLRLDQFDKAEALVERIGKDEPDDLQVLLLQGAIAAKKGDRRAARQFYDRAVTKDPSNPNAFFQRALFNIGNEDAEARKAIVPDILQDLDQVTRLRPSMLTAWTKRYSLLRELGRDDEAFAVIRKAIDANPRDDDVRLMLVQDLARSGKILEMQNELLRAAGEREDEIRWLRLGARILSQPGIERYKEAADLLTRYYERKPEPAVTRELLDALLRPGVNAEFSRVQKYLAEFDKFSAKEEEASYDLFDMMLQARARRYTTQNDRAERHLDEALAYIKDEGKGGAQFMQYLIFCEGSHNAAMEWLKNKSKQITLNPYLQNLVIGARRREEKPERLVLEANELLTRAADDVTRVEILRTISTIQYTVGRYQESADAAREAVAILEKDPDHARIPMYMEILNNLAYTLVSQLNKPADGVVYAEKAVNIRPNSSTALDTLGWAYHQAGDFKKAVDTLTRAAQTASNRDDAFIASLHLAKAQHSAGDSSEARRTFRKVEEEARSPDTRVDELEEYATLLDSLRKDLE